MAEQTKINTTLARRDVSRMTTAIGELEKVKKQYSNAITNLSSVYKGNASSFLQEQIASVKIKEISSIIKSLETARTQLNQTITKAEQVNNSIIKAIKG